MSGGGFQDGCAIVSAIVLVVGLVLTTSIFGVILLVSGHALAQDITRHHDGVRRMYLGAALCIPMMASMALFAWAVVRKAIVSANRKGNG